MSDLRIQGAPAEEMVGAGHPTKADTLNRLFLGRDGVQRHNDGSSNFELLNMQSSAPSTAAAQSAFYVDTSGLPCLRGASDGDVVIVGGRARKNVIQLNQTISAPGGTGWQSGTVALGATLTLANARLTLGMGCDPSGASGQATEDFYAFIDATTLYWRGYFTANYPFELASTIEEFYASQLIQRGQPNCFAGGATGQRTEDITITAVDDYTKAVVNILNKGRYLRGEATATNLASGVSGKLTSATNLRLTANVSSTDTTGFKVSYEIYPLS